MRKVALIGAGNINWHLGHALNPKYYEICQVYSRTRKSAGVLAKSLNCSFTTSLDKVNLEADIVLIAVHDDAIEQVAKKLGYLENERRIFIHTSGVTPIAVLEKHFSLCGVLWPPQSIRKENKINIKKTPIIVVANDDSKQGVLLFATRLSRKVKVLTDEQKRNLHLAAVFANNFSNHLFKIAYDICQDQNLDFELLLPIIKETTDKISGIDPALFQTGPAIRGDEKTMKAHLDLLSKNKDLKRIYTIMSKHINPIIK